MRYFHELACLILGMRNNIIANRRICRIKIAVNRFAGILIIMKYDIKIPKTNGITVNRAGYFLNSCTISY